LTNPAGAGGLAFEEAVLGLLGHLSAHAYHFITPHRSTHALIRGRRAAEPTTLLRDVFGWARPFERDDLPSPLHDLLEAAGLVEPCAEGFRSRVRVSSVGDLLFAHSAPSAGKSARFLRHALGNAPPARRALDIGAGAGVGALTLLNCGLTERAVAVDVNPEALAFAALNARHARLPLGTVLGAGVPSTGEAFDLIVANPPFIAGKNAPTYSDGGGLYGAALSLEWACQSLAALTEGGRMVLYTGAPILEGVDLVREALTDMAGRSGFRLSYDEIDPDIFGASLKRSEYEDVERIAAVGAILYR
jgi:SAM-dependent methyltransferase